MRLRYGRLLAALTAAAVLVTAMPVTAAQDTSGIMEEAGNDSTDPGIIDVMTANVDPVMESDTDVLSADSDKDMLSADSDTDMLSADSDKDTPAAPVEPVQPGSYADSRGGGRRGEDHGRQSRD